MKKQSLFFVLGIVLIGTVLRSPFTALPTILGDIAQGLGVEVSSLGILTSLPLLMFALLSAFASRLAQKNRTRTSLYLLSPPLNCWLCHSDFQSSPSLSRDPNCGSKHCDLQCTAPKYDPGNQPQKISS